MTMVGGNIVQDAGWLLVVGYAKRGIMHLQNQSHNPNTNPCSKIRDFYKFDVDIMHIIGV